MIRVTVIDGTDPSTFLQIPQSCFVRSSHVDMERYVHTLSMIIRFRTGNVLHLDGCEIVLKLAHPLPNSEMFQLLTHEAFIKLKQLQQQIIASHIWIYLRCGQSLETSFGNNKTMATVDCNITESLKEIQDMLIEEAAYWWTRKVSTTADTIGKFDVAIHLLIKFVQEGSVCVMLPTSKYERQKF